MSSCGRTVVELESNGSRIAVESKSNRSCSCSTDIRTQSVRAHHTKPTPVTLATHTLHGASSLNYVALCTQLSPDAVQRIWRASCNQPHSRVLVCDRHLSTLLYCGQGPSSASGPSLTPARLRGTHCRAISAKQSIPLVLGSC